MWQQHCSSETLSDEDEKQLALIETQDSVFAHVDPSLWAKQ
jgi:hypothetical protein